MTAKDIVVFDDMMYDPLTGHIRWTRTGRGRNTAKPIGTKTGQGYLQCTAGGKQYKVHRLAWFLYYGEWPEEEIDHINKVKDDNRIENLRVGKSINSRNRVMPSLSGIRGAHWSSSKGKWRSSIRIEGEVKHLGWFETPEEAAAAYTKAYKEIT